MFLMLKGFMTIYLEVYGILVVVAQEKTSGRHFRCYKTKGVLQR